MPCCASSSAKTAKSRVFWEDGAWGRRDMRERTFFTLSQRLVDYVYEPSVHAADIDWAAVLNVALGGLHAGKVRDLFRQCFPSCADAAMALVDRDTPGMHVTYRCTSTIVPKLRHQVGEFVVAANGPLMQRLRDYEIRERFLAIQAMHYEHYMHGAPWCDSRHADLVALRMFPQVYGRAEEPLHRGSMFVRCPVLMNQTEHNSRLGGTNACSYQGNLRVHSPLLPPTGDVHESVVVDAGVTSLWGSDGSDPLWLELVGVVDGDSRRRLMPHSAAEGVDRVQHWPCRWSVALEIYDECSRTQSHREVVSRVTRRFGIAPSGTLLQTAYAVLQLQRAADAGSLLLVDDPEVLPDDNIEGVAEALMLCASPKAVMQRAVALLKARFGEESMRTLLSSVQTRSRAGDVSTHWWPDARMVAAPEQALSCGDIGRLLRLWYAASSLRDEASGQLPDLSRCFAIGAGALESHTVDERDISRWVDEVVADASARQRIVALLACQGPAVANADIVPLRLTCGTHRTMSWPLPNDPIATLTLFRCDGREIKAAARRASILTHRKASCCGSKLPSTGMPVWFWDEEGTDVAPTEAAIVVINFMIRLEHAPSAGQDVRDLALFIEATGSGHHVVTCLVRSALDAWSQQNPEAAAHACDRDLVRIAVSSREEWCCFTHSVVSRETARQAPRLTPRQVLQMDEAFTLGPGDARDTPCMEDAAACGRPRAWMRGIASASHLGRHLASMTSNRWGFCDCAIAQFCDKTKDIIAHPRGEIRADNVWASMLTGASLRESPESATQDAQPQTRRLLQWRPQLMSRAPLPPGAAFIR